MVYGMMWGEIERTHEVSLISIDEETFTFELPTETVQVERVGSATRITMELHHLSDLEYICRDLEDESEERDRRASKAVHPAGKGIYKSR
jgi:hypothetical protein